MNYNYAVVIEPTLNGGKQLEYYKFDDDLDYKTLLKNYYNGYKYVLIELTVEEAEWLERHTQYSWTWTHITKD